MRAIYVGRLTTEQIKSLQQGLRSSSAFTVRRCQILLKSAEWQKPSQIASQLHCSDQTVRDAIRGWQVEGPASLVAKSHARHDLAPLVSGAGCDRLKELVHLSPRSFGYESSLWTRPRLAAVLYREGYTSKVVSVTNISTALQRAGIGWRRAKKVGRSPDQHYERRKKDATD
jgi:hypothetical protein